MNSGGKHTLFNAICATVDVGDEVIIPAPYWVSYPDIVNFAGGTPVIISAGANQLYKILPEQLEAAITPKTRWVLLNSPSNPTGAAYSGDELIALGEVFAPASACHDPHRRHVRACLVRANPVQDDRAGLPDLYERTLTVKRLLQGLFDDGWRIGYAGGPQWIIKAMGKLQSQSTSTPARSVRRPPSPR